MRILKLLGGLSLLLVVAAALAWYLYFRPIPDFGRKVLVFSKTAEYRHDSIEAGIEAITELGRDAKFNVEATEDPAQFSEQSLPNYRAVIFLNTTGDVLDAEQQEAFERYIQAGGGYVGIHAAAATEWKDNSWPWYTRLVGAAFLSHPNDPNVRQALVEVVDGTHPATQGLEQSWQHTDEWYDYQRVNPSIKVLVNVDESSYLDEPRQGEHPIAWYHDFDGGRSFYTGMGHAVESFAEQPFLQHLGGGIAYAMGQDGALDYSAAQPESWRLKRVVLDSGLNEATALAFRPDGALFYVERKGGVKRFDFESANSLPVAELEVYQVGENGLVGMVFDPGFEDNHWVYLFHTLPGDEGPAHVLSRYRMVDDKIDTAAAVELLRIPIEAGQLAHTGGSLQFDDQGLLWISVGDNTNPHESDGYAPIDDRPGRREFDAARGAGNTMDLRGKILRIRPEADGSYSIPKGNLFSDPQQGRPEIYAMGLRNPYRMYVDSKTDTLYWGEVGPDARENSEQRGPWGYDEINRTREPGNFGWPFLIASNQPYAYYDFAARQAGDFVDPAAPENRSSNNTGAAVLPPARPAWIAYPYVLDESLIELGEGGRSAMVAGIYYRDDYPADNPVKLPSYFDGKLFVYDWMRHWVKAITLDGEGGVQKIESVMGGEEFSAPIDMRFAPDGSLYMLEYGSAWFSQNDDAYLTRIEYYGGDNPPPVPVATVDRSQGAVPLTVQLQGSESFDRNGSFEDLQFSWELMDKGKPSAQLGSDMTIEYAIAEAGEYRFRLTVRDAGGASDESFVDVVAGNEPPGVDFVFRAGNSSFYWEDTPLAYQVVVQDLEDGNSMDGSIEPGAVAVTFDYIPEGYDQALAAAGHQAASAQADGWAAMEASDCLSCHTRDRQSVGPSFSAIAEKYDSDALQELTDKVLRGGGGVWGSHAMPPHPQLSEDSARAMVGWILDPAGSDGTTGGMALAGELAFDRHRDSMVQASMGGEFSRAVYMLNASYRDKGAAGMPPLKAQAERVLRYPVLMAGDASVVEGAMLMPIPADMVGDEGLEGLKIAILRSPVSEEAASYLLYEDIDLTGISTIQIGLTTTSLFTTGGELSLRVGGPDGPLLGTQEIENANIGLPDSLDFFSFAVADMTGVHDLYVLSSRVVEEESNRPAFLLMSVSFHRE